MKKLYKLFGALIAVTAIFVGTQAIAAGGFAALNTHPQDLLTVTVKNVTKVGTNTQGWGPSVSADAGDIIGVQVYYHNSGNDVARNVRVHIDPVTSAQGTNFQVSGGVTALNASPAFGGASVNLTSAQTFTYIPGSAVWRPDQMFTSSRPFPNGDGDNFVSQGGVSIGDIQPDPFQNQFMHQGVVVANFRVGNATPPPPPPPPPAQCPTIATVSGVPVTPTVATFSGSLVSMGTAPSATVFFEYSTNATLTGAARTSDQARTTTSSVTDTVGGLIPDTTYFFRAVVTSPNCRGEGAVLSLHTPANPIIPPVVPPVQPVASTTIIVSGGAQTQTQTNTQSNSQSVTVNAGGGGQGYYPSYYPSYYPTYTPPPVYVAPVVSTPAYIPPPPPVVLRSTIPPRAQTISCTRGPATNSAMFSGFTEGDVFGQDLRAWFEWGPTPALGNRTPIQPILSRGSINPIDRTILRVPNYGDPYYTGTRNLSYDSIIVPNRTSSLGASNFTAQVNYLENGQIYFFRAVSENSAGTSYGDTLACRLEGGDLFLVPHVVNVAQISAVTKPATDVTQNGAVIRGYVASDARTCLRSSFEWGPTPALGFRTPLRDHGVVAVANNAEPLTGLMSGTTYYFRINGEGCDNTRASGLVLNFTTPAPVIITHTAPVGRVEITKTAVNNSHPEPRGRVTGVAGETIGYAITVRNVGDGALTNVRVTDRLSPYLRFMSASDNGSVSGPLEAQTVSWNLGTLATGEMRLLTADTSVVLCEVEHIVDNVARFTSNEHSATSNNSPVTILPKATVSVASPMMQQNTYGAMGNMNGLAVQTSNMNMVPAQGPLVFMIVPPQVSATPGEQVVLSLRYQNQSNETLGNVALRSFLPIGAEFVSADNGQGQMVNFDRTTAFTVGNLAPGAMGELRLTMRVAKTTSSGDQLILTGLVSYNRASGERVDGDASATILVAGAANTNGNAISNLNRSGVGPGLLGSAFFPTSIFGWLGLILLILVILFVVRKSL